MDPQEASPMKTERSQKKGLPFVLLRCSLALLFPIIIFFSMSFLVGFVVVFAVHSQISSPISVPSQCKIVSSSVDLRSAKVFELGLFNYKAKHVFYPLERSKFRCHYDYYWASIFKVEYKDHSSGQIQLAFAEAPSEALPLNCRPNFGAAWLTKDKFKADLATDKPNIVLFNVNFSNGLPQELFRGVRSTNFFPKKWAIHALDVGFGFNCLLVYMVFSVYKRDHLTILKLMLKLT